MKKTLTALLLCACCASAYGLETIDYEWIQEGQTLVIKSDCSLSEAAQIYAEKYPEGSPEHRIQFGVENQGIELRIDMSQILPKVGEIDFVSNCELLFDGLYTLRADPNANPYIYVGTPSAGESIAQKANLTITFSDSAIREALSGEDTAHLVEHSLVEGCMFGIDQWHVQPPNTISFKFGDATEGNVYKYNEHQTYRNDGLVNAGDVLNQNTAVLYFAGSPAPVGTGFQSGTFTVAFVGSEYIPVPEPATGTLSLLALAGLCARRRRK